jgi:hypothetical protein
VKVILVLHAVQQVSIAMYAINTMPIVPLHVQVLVGFVKKRTAHAYFYLKKNRKRKK